MFLFCAGAINKPVVSVCCQSLIGCSACIDQLLTNSDNCPKCRAANAKEGLVKLRGLDNVFAVLAPAVAAGFAMV